MPLETPTGKAWLLAMAAPAEARAVLEGLGAPGGSVIEGAARSWPRIRATERFDLLLSGVGKGNAAGAVAHALDPARCAGVLSLGICGSLPGSGLRLGDVVCATESLYADEGVGVPGGFTDLAAMGFPPGESGSMGVANAEAPARLIEEEAPIGLRIVRGRIATVSTCSGTDDHARQIVARTGAVGEAMEGAAIGFVVARLAPELPFAEVRVVSNTTGDRGAQAWDLKGALSVLSRIAGVL